MSASLDEAIAALANRQRGYVTRAQLLDLGLGREAIRRRRRAHRLIPVYAGVYAVGHVPTLPNDRAAGALLACGPGAVLSHASAAAVWGIFKRWELPFEVTTTSSHHRQGISVHRGALAREDITRHFGLRVTSPARTVHDLAPRMGDSALTRAVNDLRRSGYLHLAQLAGVLTRHPRSKAAARLRPLLEPADGNPTRSQLEDDYVAFAERWGLPRPQVNVRVAGRELDVWYPEERVIVEIDSWQFHSDRDAFERDREKDARALAEGIATIRLTKRRMRSSPEAEAGRVLAILRRRRQETLMDL